MTSVAVRRISLSIHSDAISLIRDLHLVLRTTLGRVEVEYLNICFNGSGAGENLSEND